MDALKTLPELSDHELFDLVRLLATKPKENNCHFLVMVASDLRRRKLYVTEDHVIRLAANLVIHA